MSDPVNAWSIAPQAPLSKGFSRHKYWSGLPYPSPGDLLNPGIETVSLKSPALAGDFFTRVTWSESESRLVMSDSVNPWTVVHGILQGRILEWVAYPFSSVSSQSRNRTRVSYTAGGFYQLNHQGVTWEACLPSNLRTFSNSCLLTLGLGLALQFYYSVTRGCCFIWKLFLGEGKGNLFSIDVPEKKEKWHAFIFCRQLVLYYPLLNVCGQGFRGS